MRPRAYALTKIGCTNQRDTIGPSEKGLVTGTSLAAYPTARTVREGAGGKGPGRGHLVGGLLHSAAGATTAWSRSSTTGCARVREKLGRDAEPSAGVIDSQSVKVDAVVGPDSRGYDGGKQINGRKRHVVVDTLGLLLGVMVTSADVGDRAAARVLLARVADAHRRLALIWADGGYTGSLVEHCLAAFALVLAIVKRSDDVKGFVVLPKRWIVERLFAHLMQSRRPARDVERRTTSAEAMVYWSMTTVMTRRLARPHRGRA